MMISNLTLQLLHSLQSFVGNLTNLHCSTGRHTHPSQLLSEFSSTERDKWREPIQGVWRSQTPFYPCDDPAWVQGRWQALPMWAHCCNKDFGIARCPKQVVQSPSHCRKMQALTGKCSDDATLICPSFFRNSTHQCIVYTFGIAGTWDFEDWAGKHLNCEVHAHDPTTTLLKYHEKHSAKNVQFYYEGLKGNMSVKERTNYGEMGGQFFTLGELWERRGHRLHNKTIDFLKIDCEGCEWSSLVNAIETTPDIVMRVCTIVVEFHVTQQLQMTTDDDITAMAKFWYLYVDQMGFRLWYMHKNPGGQNDRTVHPFLLNLGLEPNVACYEVAFHRQGCMA